MTKVDNALQPIRDKASALNVLGQFSESLALYDGLVAKAPDVAPWHNERAAVLRNMDRIAEAQQACEMALSIDPRLAEAHVNFAGLLLTQGRYREGFREYEWRLKVPDCSVPALKLSAPMWDGSPAPDKTLLVVAEQGLGDTIQFIRFLAPIRERVGRLAVVVQSAVKDLCQSVAGADQVVGSGEPLPAHDLKISLLSLPHLLRTSLATLPAPTHYLDVDRASSLEGDRFRIGINWQGNSTGAGDRGRSCPLEAFKPVFGPRNAHFFSLQKNFGLEQLSAFPEIEDLGSRCTTFADTAAYMKSLDLVLTTDTAVAHVAGALGCPTWLLLKHAPTWRWLRDRQDSPWYPTMRLFRMDEGESWHSLLENVAGDLKKSTDY